MWLMQLGEVVFGGVGSGLYGMLAFVLVTVFVAGLMVGRTPEYLGKKIEAAEMKMASLMVLIPPLLVLIGTAMAAVTAAGTGGPEQPGCRTASARCSTPTPRRATTTAAPSPAWCQHALLQPDHGPGHAHRPILGWPYRPWPSPVRWRARRWSPPAPGRWPRTRRCSC